MTENELCAALRAQNDDPVVGEKYVKQVQRWLDRGDGCAVYENHDLGHPGVGHKQFVSFGSTAAQLETDTPPQRLPDIGNAINWRYQLVGTVRRESPIPERKGAP